MTQTEFIEGINKKQPTAYQELFRSFYRYLVVYATRYIGQQEEAEDVVQDVFLAVWESDKNYNSYHGFSSYLYDMVKNKCLNSLRHKSIIENHTPMLTQELLEAAHDTKYRLEKEELYRILHQAIDELPPRCREVFELHLQDKKNEEIAQILNLSIETVKTQKRNAMSILRKRLGGLYFLLIILRIM